MRLLKIGTRGSNLALWQAKHVKQKLEESNPDIQIELVIIKTEGDKKLDIPLSEIGGKGLFIKELEDFLLRKEIDIAVHSLKDMTTIIPAGLCLAAVTCREDPRDCLITHDSSKLNDLKSGTIIGTSSLRRKSLLLNNRPDLAVKLLRGNMDTRLRKLEEGEYGGIIAAAAGIKRLGKVEKITEYLPLEDFIPAVGQGALGIEVRAGDEETIQIIRLLNDVNTEDCVTAERAFLERLEGSCKAPIAAHGIISGSELKISGMVGSLDGKRIIRDSIKGDRKEAERLGWELGENLFKMGADKILKEILGG